jgi:uncharacterized protein
MSITVLGASGAVGRELTAQALARGHTVTAIARRPPAAAERLIPVAADVRDPESIAKALAGSTIVVSGLGVSANEKPGVLTAGARAVVAAAPERIVWLGALGIGTSARAAGAFTRLLIGLFLRAERADKTEADATVLAAGGTVFHTAILTGGPRGDRYRTLELDQVPRAFLPPRISRATVAAAMLDEAEHPAHPGRTVVPA